MATYIIRLNPAILCFSEVHFTAVTNTNFDEECFYMTRILNYLG